MPCAPRQASSTPHAPTTSSSGCWAADPSRLASGFRSSCRRPCQEPGSRIQEPRSHRPRASGIQQNQGNVGNQSH
ncbi:hypothetical protein ZWY2020_020844 [Hordeum vulgare]|nr:hypothetical protein ZWY2020_020844 [Hordeum vulgare]